MVTGAYKFKARGVTVKRRRQGVFVSRNGVGGLCITFMQFAGVSVNTSVLEEATGLLVDFFSSQPI